VAKLLQVRCLTVVFQKLLNAAAALKTARVAQGVAHARIAHDV
jgi:hypothetical protein